MTKQERRSAVRQFETPEARDERAQLNADLRTYINSLITESRAAGEGTNSAGGYLTPPGFASEIVRLVKEYDSVISDCEDLPTDSGNPWQRPQVQSFTASGSAASENSQLSDATSTVVTFNGLQSFSRTPTYAAMAIVSRQLLEDGMQPNGSPLDSPDGSQDLVQILASSAAESISRQVASVASTALYAAATSGQEVALTTLTVSNVAKLLSGIDPGYLPGAKLYVSPVDFASLASNDITGLRHLNDIVPVVPTNVIGNYTSGSSTTGPVLANLGRFMTMRRVRTQTMQVQKLTERYADLAQVGILVYARVDFQPRGETTSAVFSK